MAQSINLIPKQEVRLQQEKKLLTFSTIFTFVSLVITIIISVTLFALKRDLNNELVKSQSELTKYRRDINSESNIEIVARNLDKKSEVLSVILQNRTHYSNMLKELYIRKPQGIDINDISVRTRDDSVIEISGKSDSYLLVAEFLSNIINEKNNFNDSRYSNLFTDVNLNNVSLDSDGSPFSMTITFDKSILMETL